jgi:uncharacterized membrane protein YfcA
MRTAIICQIAGDLLVNYVQDSLLINTFPIFLILLSVGLAVAPELFKKRPDPA